MIKITNRELLEFKHALLYQAECGHGTAGHNQLILLAKSASALGIKLRYCPTMENTIQHVEVDYPEDVTVVRDLGMTTTGS